MKISKRDKIICTVFKMCNGQKIPIRYEDILVSTFKSFPKDFQIKYYPNYPDTDTIRRALYQLIPLGFIKISNRQCILTDAGLIRGNELSQLIAGKELISNERRNSLNEPEIKRFISLQGFKMFMSGSYDEIIDQDFFEFYKVTVRTKNLVIIGNVTQTETIIKEYSVKDPNLSDELLEYSTFLKTKFIEFIERGKNDDYKS